MFLRSFFALLCSVSVLLPNPVTCIDDFWYGNTRGPLIYDTIDYANLTVRIMRPVDEGPGQNLMHDPIHPDRSVPIYTGNTINRQSFDTQFVLDMEHALGIDRDRVYVTDVKAADVHFSWESYSVIVEFLFMERNSSATNETTLIDAVATLTAQIQTPGSPIYVGTNVTKDIEPLYGISVTAWDISLRLMYPIEIIGNTSVVDGYYINQGGLGFCDYTGSAPDLVQYCEFERFFEDDVSEALNISYYRIQILFVKKSSLDSSLIHFRVLPPMEGTGEVNVSTAIAHLLIQVQDQTSPLYQGNVTIRTDPAWGVSQTMTAPRTGEALFTYKYYDYDPRHLTTDLVTPARRPESLVTDYSRCQANRRCNWGHVEQDQSTNDVRYFQRVYDLGELRAVNLFLDFEDWRIGGRGFSWNGEIPPTKEGNTSIPLARAKKGTIRGTHFWPFDQPPLGPDIPCAFLERNQGLVLDRRLHNSQIGKQEALVYDLEGRVDWINENIEFAKMDAVKRSRKDVKEFMIKERDHFTAWLVNERSELNSLNSSQCTLQKCSIQFNTSSLLLTGAIEDTGVIRYTGDGTEVATFSFNSIYLGPDTEVILVGQRALALISKTTAVINTTFIAKAGTLGGFRGGYSVSRLGSESLIDDPRDVIICELGDYCLNRTGAVDTLTADERENLVSNNVNGAGSGNLRVHNLVMRLTTDDIDEVQYVETFAQQGQTLTGEFKIQFEGYETPGIPFDASASMVKQVMEDNLNVARPGDFPVRPLRLQDGPSGIGEISVTRVNKTSEQGYRWQITFNSAIGNKSQITATSFLQGLKAGVSTGTITHGNELGGTFVLNFQGEDSAPINANETALGLKQKLVGMNVIQTAYVERNDPTLNCDDGLCENGPFQGRGFVWSIYVTTDVTVDNYTPMSPTSPLTKEEGPWNRFTVDTSGLTGQNATISFDLGLDDSPNSFLSRLNVTRPFSLAWGGGGGSYGGLGGAGYSENPVGPTYSDDTISDLLGGSGGCMRSQHPFAINSFLGPVTGRGGHGGGAIEIVAANDIIIGTYGRVSMSGGDGEQTSQGGGGGGSGGSILLAAGGSVVNEGFLQADGGHGGFGGPGVGNERLREQRELRGEPDAHLAGGGGGGGRIAIFAESIVNTDDAIMSVEGGNCGIYKISNNETVLELNITFTVELNGLIDENILVNLVATYINLTIDTQFVTNLAVDVNGILDATLLYNVIVDNSQVLEDLETRFTSGIGTNVADVLITNTEILNSNYIFIYPVREFTTNCTNNGNGGTLLTEASMTTSMYVRETEAAENTKKALYLSNRESSFTASGSAREAPFAWNGPIIPFEPSQPTRVTFYVRLDAVPGESLKANFGVLFSILSRGVPGLNVSSVIGVFIGDKIKHGSNFGSAVDEDLFLKRLTVIDEFPAFDRWYKVDIHIRWETNTYFILLDDTLVVKDQSFEGDDADGLRLSVNRATDAWFDEIYVGYDNNLDFECPATHRQGSTTNIPEQRGWALDEVNAKDSNGFTEFHKMSRHYSHLDTTGSVPFDGQGHEKVFENINNKFSDGDFPIKAGKLYAGALRYLTNSARSGRRPSGNSATLVSDVGLWSLAKDGIGGAGDGRHYLYIELENNVNTSYSTGGVAACSSQDLSTWRFEGIVFHNENLTDMVYGTEGPFTLERPTVIFNPTTSQYVLWATMNEAGHTLGQAMVASSPFEDGPFLFRRSLYPDGNKTRDQAAFLNDEVVNGTKRAVLGRTYYNTVEYLMPEAVMQPTWESVKNRDGSTNFRLNYHRAWYDEGYDNYHDIFLQRWRGEDKEWDVKCINRITGVERAVSSGDYNEDGDVCDDPIEYKVISGQGNPPIETLFLSPDSADNSWWMQTSVPSVKAQPWASSYRDGYCGIRKLDDGIDVLDSILADFTPDERSDCSNIADNQVHGTLEDKLIGVQRVVLERRAKYIAISELTGDFMDTSGRLKAQEGELSSGNLVTLIAENGQFGFGPGSDIDYTFAPPRRSEYNTAYDYKYRFRQFIYNSNDRADYSLACVVDGVCPVNFADQLTVGHN